MDTTTPTNLRDAMLALSRARHDYATAKERERQPTPNTRQLFVFSDAADSAFEAFHDWDRRLGERGRCNNDEPGAA